MKGERGMKEGWKRERGKGGGGGCGMLEKNEDPPADWDWSAFCSTFFKDIPRKQENNKKNKSNEVDTNTGKYNHNQNKSRLW